jgi:hydrogenase/urease accessory protein HupE
MTTPASPRRRGPVRRAAAAAVAAAIGALAVLGSAALPAAAHDETTSAYAEVVRDGDRITVELELEYDLLLKSAWAYAEAYEATERAEQVRQLAAWSDEVDAYATERFAIEADGTWCAATGTGPGDVGERNGRAFAVLAYEFDCGAAASGTLAASSALFPDAEGFVHSTRTMLEWNLDGERGSGVLDAAQPSLELTATAPRFAEFVLMGAEHLVFGLDHVLFLAALVLGASSVRGLVVTATAFTVAHSVTFLLAATGVVAVPAAIVEPVIALSIAVAAAAALWRGQHDGRWRLPVVFVFGLLHGLGFAGALGIDDPWSWELLWSLLAFNVGVELAQLVIIAIAFPLLVLLRRTAAARPATLVAGVLIGATGLFWFAERLVAVAVAA